jgi:hypothetical protein
MNHKTKYERKMKERKTGLRKMRKAKEEIEKVSSKLEVKILLANIKFFLDEFESSKIYSSANLREYKNVYDKYFKEVYA